MSFIPFFNTQGFLATVAILLTCVLNSCKPLDHRDNAGMAGLIPTIDDWSFTQKIDTFLVRQPDVVHAPNSGLSKKAYLQIIEGQVRVFQQYQDKSGRIIDPVEKIEKYYSTPCYAHSVAALAAAGYTHDPWLLESGMLAMDVVTEDMAKNQSEGSHGDFYTWPVLLALHLYKGLAEKERLEIWSRRIEMMEPSKFYRAYLSHENNWNIVNLAGEFLRYRENYVSLAYTDTCLKYQLSHFTENGMYNEHGSPLPYDLFARHYLSGMLAQGYRGAFFEPCRVQAWKGAWMSLFLQSPFGELPTGFRSSHHIWNEAEQCMVFEIYASGYARAGRMEMAGAFKRGAMLSLSNIAEWIRTDGSGYIVKNRYPIEARHGYETYSVHTCYNLLATSMLAQAWQFSDDAVAERPAPADIGGFVAAIHDPFHKIIATADGSYVEYDTRGDQIYNPTGILRIHIRGSHPQLGPSDGCASKFSGKGVSVATGPAWQNDDGTWTSLAALRPGDPSIDIIEETPKAARFKVTYRLKDDLGKPFVVMETISAERGKITVEDEIKGDVDRMRVIWPMLVFNGRGYSRILIERNAAILELEGKNIKFQLAEPKNIYPVKSGSHYQHRNGIVEPLMVEFQGNKAIYSICIVD